MKLYGKTPMMARVDEVAHKIIKDVCFYKGVTVATFVTQSTIEMTKKLSANELRELSESTPYGTKQLVMMSSDEFREYVKGKALRVGLSLSKLMATCAYHAAKKENITLVARTRDKRLA